MRRWLLWGGTALVLGLAAAEAGLRWGVGLGDPPLAVLDAAVEYRLVPDASYSRWGNRIDINRHGLRGPRINDAAAPKTRRVLLIGDSIVYGTNFLDQAETISARLTARLADDPRLAGCAPQAIAMGVSSWGPVNQAAFLARLGPFDADTAAILVSAHDLYDVPRDDGADILPYRLHPSHTAIGDAATIAAERLLRRETPPPAGFFARAEAETLAALDAMAAYLAEAGVPVTLVYHPTVTERAGAPSPQKARFEDWAAGAGLPVLDLASALPAPGGYRDDIHPDADGADRIAGALAEVLTLDLAPCGP